MIVRRMKTSAAEVAMPKRLPLGVFALFVLITGILTIAASHETQPQLEPDGAPDRQSDGAGVPRPIVWPTPPLGRGPFMVESAEERHVRVIVVARGLEQPWSVAFLPNGDVFVTERPGRPRIIRHGVLDAAPISGVPQVHSTGLQGLMDVVLHPRFSENGWVYLTYHKPVGTTDGAP